jgi:hypothetical protein
MLLNRIRHTRVLVSLLLGLGAGIAAGAISACDSTSSNCSDVCGRYHECVDSNYDVAACETKCGDKAGKDRDFDDRLTHCRACSDGRACSEIVANCIPACAGVVP